MSGREPFDDVDNEIARTSGVLSGDAFENQEKVIEKLNPDRVGYDFTVRCQHCNKTCVVTLPWSELIVAGMRLVPADEQTGVPWIHDKGFLYPQVRCGYGNGIYVPITPDKANRYIQSGCSAGFITEQQVMAHRQKIQAAARAHGR